MSKFHDIIRHDCGPRYDANETAAFSRELEYVFAEVIRAKYPDFTWRDVVPITGGGAPLGLTATRWFEVDGFGEAKFLDNLATEDFPTQEIQGKENTGKIRSMGAKYMVTVEELRAAQQMRVKVETEKPLLARRSIESLYDKTVWGSRSTNYGGFPGLIADASSNAATATAVSWITFCDPTNVEYNPQAVVKNVKDMIDEAFLLSKGLFQTFDLFVPPELGNVLQNPMAVVANGVQTVLNQTILSYMLNAIARLRSVKTDCFRLSAAGASGKHRILCYPNDPTVLDAFVPIDFEQFAPQLSGMSFVTHCHAKYGGLRIKHPSVIRRMDVATT